MKNNMNYESQLERKVHYAFSQQGWDCEMERYYLDISKTSRFCPDIVLKKDNKVYGFVECYTPRKNSVGKEKQVIYIVEHIKPELFVLTNGISYEVYISGRYIDTMTVPISFEGYKQARKVLGGGDVIERGENQ